MWMANHTAKPNLTENDLRDPSAAFAALRLIQCCFDATALGLIMARLTGFPRFLSAAFGAMLRMNWDIQRDIWESFRSVWKSFRGVWESF
jgi:hypothetical protein